MTPLAIASLAVALLVFGTLGYLGIPLVSNLYYRFNPIATVAPLSRRRCGAAAAADAATLAVVKKLGITRARRTIIWANYLDTRKWAADRSTEDEVNGKTNAEWFAVDMATFATAGIDVLVVVHTPPVGMTLAQGIVAMPTFMATLASTFPGRTWEILNEPNTEDAFNAAWFSASDVGVNDTTRGDRYGTVIGPVYDAIKAADPTATVITGGTGAPQNGFYTGLAATAAGKFNGFGIHAFGAPDAFTNFKELAILMAAAAPGLALWCTEFGNSQALDTQAAQAAQSADVGNCLDDNDRNTRYAHIYVYTLISTDGYNVARSDETLRQAALLLMNRTDP